MKTSKLIRTPNCLRTAILTGIAVIVSLIQGSGYGQAEASKNEKTAPLHVTSDKMIAQKETSMVEFIGNVKATRLTAVLLADSIKVYFQETADTKETDPQGNVKKIIATGSVRYTEGERKAFADEAVYTTADEILVLTGVSPKLQTGTSFVTGKKITLFRNQDRVMVESDGSQRVEALFNPEDNIKKEQ